MVCAPRGTFGDFFFPPISSQSYYNIIFILLRLSIKRMTYTCVRIYNSWQDIALSSWVPLLLLLPQSDKVVASTVLRRWMYLQRVVDDARRWRYSGGGSWWSACVFISNNNINIIILYT